MTAREFDHGELNIPGRLKNLDAEIDRQLAAQAREKNAQHRADVAARKATRLAEQERPKFTAADLIDAVAVRDQYGWHRIVRVSAKSVTVTTPYSWTERIPLDRVLEVRT